MHIIRTVQPLFCILHAYKVVPLVAVFYNTFIFTYQKKKGFHISLYDYIYAYNIRNMFPILVSILSSLFYFLFISSGLSIFLNVLLFLMKFILSHVVLSCIRKAAVDCENYKNAHGLHLGYSLYPA